MRSPGFDRAAIRVVFLDVDDTLLDFDACAEQAMEQARGELGVGPIDFPAFLRINLALWKQLERGELTKQQLFHERWSRVFEALGVEGDGPVFEAHFRRALTQAAVPMPGAAALTAYLAGRYTLCAASNAPHMQQVRRLAQAGLLQDLKRVFTSESCGAPKPSAAFFDACFTALAPLRPEQTVMIGDSATADVAGAAAYGMHTIWFDRCRAGGTAGAEHAVQSLEEILSLL